MEQVSESSDLWRLTLEHSPIGMALASPDGRVLMANPALAAMLGLSLEELARKDFRELTHPDDLDVDVELYEQTIAGVRDSYRLTKRYLHASGRVVWGDLSVALVRDAEGRPQHFISQVLDVSERNAVTEAAVADRRTLEAIFDSVGVGLLLIDSDGRYQRMNPRHAEAMLVPFPDGHSGRAAHPVEAFQPDGRTPMRLEERPSYRAMQGEEFDDVTYWVGHDSRRRAAFAVSARQVRGPAGQSAGAVLAYQDVTELLRAVQARDEFVSSVSHELRTPLASVLGYLELAVDHPALPEEVAHHLAVVERNALRLRALLSDLLDVAQAREGALVLDRAPVRVWDLVHEAIEAALPLAQDAGLEIVLDLSDTAELVVEADEHRLRQVLDNLLSNAVKYSDGPGRIHVLCTHSETEVELAVSDTGMGVAPEELERVFDRFFRGAEALEQQRPGTGLGLNIVRSIVEAHGGTITVESELGVGSTFRVVLPVGGVRSSQA